MKMKKKNSYGCSNCKLLNPRLVLIERWDKLQDEPYAIEILIRKGFGDKEHYDSTNIKLQKKMTKGGFKFAVCTSCNHPIEEIPPAIAERIRKNLKKSTKKRNTGE
ncbi:MAG: hypothetical protein CMG66_05930 [Candidatus Marinimicrobia bacterium]|nr:hypothetical protein [Candidatus Neomarinimicrobiota bacterium]|tara:strand:+ start:20727 stop:21044 length:318 start_codon:yes stop_codon:yes gene_type:complete